LATAPTSNVDLKFVPRCTDSQTLKLNRCDVILQKNNFYNYICNLC